MTAAASNASVRAILVTDFPDSFVERSVLPELRKRVDVIMVSKTLPAARLDLASYAPDVVLHMVEFGSHSHSSLLSATCRKAGITVRALSRKKAFWSFLPPPRAVVAPIPPIPFPTEIPKMEQQKNGTNGTPIRATIGDLPGARAVLRPELPPPPQFSEKKQDVVVLELSAGALAVISSLTQALGKHGADALLEHARAMRELAKAISGMPAAVQHGGNVAAEPKADSVTVMVEKKILEIVSKFSGLGSAEIHVLVTNGAGSGGVKVSRASLLNALSKLVKDAKVTRTGAGGSAEPYLYFPIVAP